MLCGNQLCREQVITSSRHQKSHYVELLVDKKHSISDFGLDVLHKALFAARKAAAYLLEIVISVDDPLIFICADIETPDAVTIKLTGCNDRDVDRVGCGDSVVVWGFNACKV